MVSSRAIGRSFSSTRRLVLGVQSYGFVIVPSRANRIPARGVVRHTVWTRGAIVSYATGAGPRARRSVPRVRNLGHEMRRRRGIVQVASCRRDDQALGLSIYPRAQCPSSFDPYKAVV